MYRVEKYIENLLMIGLIILVVLGIGKGLLYAFETFPERIAFFGANFGK